MAGNGQDPFGTARLSAIKGGHRRKLAHEQVPESIHLAGHGAAEGIGPQQASLARAL